MKCPTNSELVFEKLSITFFNLCFRNPVATIWASGWHGAPRVSLGKELNGDSKDIKVNATVSTIHDLIDMVGKFYIKPTCLGGGLIKTQWEAILFPSSGFEDKVTRFEDELARNMNAARTAIVPLAPPEMWKNGSELACVLTQHSPAWAQFDDSFVGEIAFAMALATDAGKAMLENVVLSFLPSEQFHPTMKQSWRSFERFW